MAQTEPVQLSERVYYLPGGVNCAVILNGSGGALLVDTGQDKSYGARLRRACEGLGVTPLAILNTHSHADHYGGNAYLLRNCDLKVYAPPFEASVLQSPYLEPVYLFNGAKPPPELLSKWLLAKPSRVDTLVEAGEHELAGVTLRLLDTSGHAHRQVSVLVDGVLIAADALFGREVLSKYPLPFGQDVAKQIESARALTEVAAHTALPGHGRPTHEVEAIIASNLAAFDRAARAVEAACVGGSTEEVLARVCDALSVEISDLPRYYLNLCVVSAYLSYLRAEGRVDLELANNRLRWQRS